MVGDVLVVAVVVDVAVALVVGVDVVVRVVDPGVDVAAVVVSTRSTGVTSSSFTDSCQKLSASSRRRAYTSSIASVDLNVMVTRMPYASARRSRCRRFPSWHSTINDAI